LTASVPALSAGADDLEIRRPAIFGGRVVGGFTTRHGGLSEAEFASLNLGLSTGDAEVKVRANRDRVFARLDKEGRDLAVAGQIHGTHVAVVGGPGLYAGTDSLVTVAPGQVLAITVADCAAVLMADERAGVVAACHAGWRGAVGRICTATLDCMLGLGAHPGDVRIYVSPCIGAEWFEVGDEVAERFERRHVIRRASWPRPHVDLKQAIVDEVISRGVAPEAVEVSPESTYDSPHYYSYRSSGGRTGRMMGFIMLRAEESD